MKKNPDTFPSQISRRKFIHTTVGGGLGVLSLSAHGKTLSPLDYDSEIPDWVSRVRTQIPAVSESLYFQTGAFGPSPLPVVERIKELLDIQNRGPADPRYLKVMQEAENACRPLVAEAFGAASEEVALTHNTTSGLNTVIWSIDWKAGDELIISDQEHPALLLPTYNLLQRFGVQYRRIRAGTGESIVENVLAAVTSKTRLVAISHVSRESGNVVPAKLLAHELRERNIRFLLDGAQGPGNTPFHFHDIGCDYYSLCGHKWLLGPKGTGALLIRKDLLDSTAVSWTGSRAQSEVDQNGNFQWQPDARRYEFATRALAVFGGFAESMRWLKAIGWENIHQRISDLSLYASKRIIENNHFQLISPSEDNLRNGIVVLKLPTHVTGREMYEKLGHQDHILVSPLQHTQHLRICVHFFNTTREFDMLLKRLEYYCA